MFKTQHHLSMARTLGVALVAALSLSACATYDDEFAGINSRLDQLDTKVQARPRAPNPPTSPPSRQPAAGPDRRPRAAA